MAAALFSHPQKNVDDLIKKQIPLDVTTYNRAAPLPNSAVPGYSPIYRNILSPERLLEVPHGLLNTLFALFESAAAVAPEKPCFGSRVPNGDGTFGDYQWQLCGEIQQRRNNFGAGLFFVLQNNPFKTDLPAHAKIDTHFSKTRLGKAILVDDLFIVSIFSHNRPEWVLTDLACTAYALPNTALYDTLGANTSKYILGLTESPILVLSKDKIRKVLDLKRQFPDDLKNLITLVSMDKLDTLATLPDAELFAQARALQLTLFDFEQVERLGAINPVAPIPPAPETVYTISFTSGTTGANPKGVVLTHKNAVAGCTFCLMAVSAPTEGATTYCFLPLAHIYERCTVNFSLFRNVGIGFPLTNLPLSLLEDIKSLRPKLLNLVPRVYTKLEAAIKAQTINNDEKPLLKLLFTRAINKKMELQSIEDGHEGRHILYDRLIGVLRKKLGMDNLLGFTSGSAPLGVDTTKFMKAALNAGLSQGYGLTESFAGVCSTVQYDANPGSCGPIAATTEMKLREIPEMNYYANDKGGPRGELLLRGPQIFCCYYKNPEETAKAVDADGWFHTGDIARVEEGTGKLFIIDRVKNFFKLAQGEYITPEKIETTYLSAMPLVLQLYVHGDSLKTFLVAVVGVDAATIEPWLKSRFKATGLSQEDIVKKMNETEVKRKFLQEMNAAVGSKLSGLEKVHNIYVDYEPLTVEKDLVTPTLKIKRPIAKKYFNDIFEELYSVGSLIKLTESKL